MEGYVTTGDDMETRGDAEMERDLKNEDDTKIEVWMI